MGSAWTTTEQTATAMPVPKFWFATWKMEQIPQNIYELIEWPELGAIAEMKGKCCVCGKEGPNINGFIQRWSTKMVASPLNKEIISKEESLFVLRFDRKVIDIFFITTYNSATKLNQCFWWIEKVLKSLEKPNGQFELCCCDIFFITTTHLVVMKKMSRRKTPKLQRFRGFFTPFLQVQIKRCHPLFWR